MIRPCSVVFLLSSLLIATGNWAAPNAPPKPAKGIVSNRASGCDYFVAATEADYDLLEWYGGHDSISVMCSSATTNLMASTILHDETENETLRV